MLKCGHLVQPFMRRGIGSLLFQVRHKIHVVDKTFLPAFLEGIACIGKFPYSVEIEPIDSTRMPNFPTDSRPMDLTRLPYYPKAFEPIDSTRLPDFPTACATLFIRTSDDQDLDSALIEEFEKNINYKVEAAFEKDVHYIQVYCNERKKHTSILPPNVEVGVRLEVPVKFGVKVTGGRDAPIYVKNLEGETYEITTENASCYLTNLKGSYISVETDGGSIVCDSSLIYTFGSLVTRGDGDISASKLQGSKFYLETEEGKIDVKAVYLKRSEFCSQGGDIQLGDIHGITEVEAETGNISIASVTGDLKALTRQGDIDIHLAEHNNVDMQSKEGNVKFSISESPQPSQVNIKSKHLHIAENVDMQVDLEEKGENFTVLSARTYPGVDTKDKRTLNVQAKVGEVNVNVANWLDSLKLTRS